MYSFDQQQTNFWSNLHNSCSPCNLGYESLNPFHQHQNYHLPNQMGNFLPQSLDQDPSNPRFDPNPRYSNFPDYHPIIAPYEMFTHMNQASLGGNPSPRKDRHTKISTAQGVRDRRVRLSMAVAREFFDLQDMLGFDKASSTIEWLLAKSKAAIQELVLKLHGSRSTRSTSNSPSSDHEGGGPFRKKRSRTLARPGSSSCKSPDCSQDGIEKIIVDDVVDSSIARGSRAKTRAREKLSTMAPKPIDQFGDLGLQTSGKSAACSSQLLMDKQGCNALPRNLNGLNVITSKDSSPANSCTDYLQNLLSSYSTGDQDAPPNSLLGSNYNHPGDSSFFQKCT